MDARATQVRGVGSESRDSRSVGIDAGSVVESSEAGSDATTVDSGAVEHVPEAGPEADTPDDSDATVAVEPDADVPDPVEQDSGPSVHVDSGSDQDAEDSGSDPEPMCPGFERWTVEVGECLYVKNATRLSPTALENGECLEHESQCSVYDNVGQNDGEPIERWITPYNPEDNSSVVVRYQLEDGQCPKTCSK